MANFILAPSALDDLNDIWLYIAEDNQEAADKFIRSLTSKFSLLAESNRIGTKQDDFMVGMYMFPFKSYNIYYFTNDNGVEIYRVLHGRRDVENIFEGFLEN